MTRLLDITGLAEHAGGLKTVTEALYLRDHLLGRLAKLVTRGYHLYALPTGSRRTRVAIDWALAGRRPDDVSLSATTGGSALIVNAEDSDG